MIEVTYFETVLVKFVFSSTTLLFLKYCLYSLFISDRIGPNIAHCESTTQYVKRKFLRFLYKMKKNHDNRKSPIERITQSQIHWAFFHYRMLSAIFWRTFAYFSARVLFRQYERAKILRPSFYTLVFYILFLYPRLFIPLNTLYITSPVFFRPAVFSPSPQRRCHSRSKSFCPKAEWLRQAIKVL